MSRRPRAPTERRAVAVATLALTSTLAAAPGSAQSSDIQGTTEVSVPRANFRADCSMNAEVIATLTEGEEVELLGTAGSWYRVRHTESGIEGCMHHSVLGTVTSLSEEEAEGLEEWEEEAQERGEEAREREQEAREAEWAARRARGEKRVTGYLDLNPVGYGTPGEDRLHFDGSLFSVDGAGRPVAIPNSHFENDFDYSFSTREETVVGGHLGTDVTYFFSKVFGIGASVIFSRATEEFEFSPPDLAAGEQIVEEVILGGLSATLGVRFRF